MSWRVSGNFDFPPATQGQPTSDISSIPARFRDIRQALQRERERDRATWDQAAADRQRDQHLHGMPPRTLSASHRRLPGPRGSSQPSRSSRRVTHASDGPPSSLGRRPRSTREIYAPSRLRRGQSSREHPSSGLSELEEASERLGELSSRLSDMMDPPSGIHRRSSPCPNIASFLTDDALDQNDDDEESRRRMKRRKLDHNDGQESYPTINYGHFGQVVAGSLKMEIVSCDGGHFKHLYRADNMLRNDKSVYCSEHSRCNLLLRHQGETLFSLERLIIKSPDIGFTAPYVPATASTSRYSTNVRGFLSLQEGLVFVSMSAKGLLGGAASYNIHYSPIQPPPPYRSSRLHRLRDRSRERMRQRESTEDQERGLTLLESLHDEQMWETYSRQRDRNAQTDLNTPSWYDGDDNDPTSYNDCEWVPAATILNQDTLDAERTEPSLRDFRAPTPPPPPQIRVTTDSSPPDVDFADIEETTSAEVLADRSFREARWRRFDGGDDDQLPPLDMLWREATGGSSLNRRSVRAYRDGAHVTQNRRKFASKIEPTPREESVSRTGTAEGPGGKVLEPHAQFFIEEDKSLVCIKFDPPM